LVVSSNDQLHLNTVVIVPLTSKGRPAPYRIPSSFGGRSSLIVTDQMRSLDKRRCLRRLGVVDPIELSATLAILRDTFEE
jgi:mRNA interferase MazF